MTTQELDHALNQQVLGGDIMGAFDKFYADDVVMQENSLEPISGKTANRERELQFVGSIAEFHFDGADIGTDLPLSIGQTHFPLLHRLQLQLHGHMLGNAEE